MFYKITVECKACLGNEEPCRLTFKACGSTYMEDLTECPFKPHKYKSKPTWIFVKKRIYK